MRRWLCIVVLFQIFLLFVLGLNPVQSFKTGPGSRESDPSLCPSECPICPEVDCTQTVMDQCGCCPVCIRELGESCGSSEGVCASHLSCVQLNDEEVGKCTGTSGEKCLKANCSVVFHPICPSDSRLVILPPPTGQCCGEPGICHCDQQKCESSVPNCESGFERVLMKAGMNEPGRCCDVFECRKRDSRCEGVHCPHFTFEEDEGTECPADSVRPAEHVPKGGCCPIRPGCRCRASVCRPAVCPEGKKLRVSRKGNGNPGRCCDEWKCEDDLKAMAKSCERDGRHFPDGAEWLSNSCESCQCKKGVAVCRKMDCPKPPNDCTWVMIPEGECCPVCVGCQTDKREKKKKHEQWQKDDCTTCTCSEDGTVICEKYMCSVSCENPRKVEGQCCPVCDEPTVLTLPSSCPSLEHCPLRCENGLQRDDRGCFECKCLPVEHPENKDCIKLNKDNCDKIAAEYGDGQCAHGYSKDSTGCLVCKCAKCPPLHRCFKHCLYGFETNSVECPVCKCRARSRIEARLTITDKMGRLAGWDKCVSLTSSGKVIERDGGEWWNDGCRHCFCEQKQEFCSLISCPPKPDDCPEDKWIQAEGACCPTCTLTAPTSPSALATSKHEHTVCQSPGTGRLFTDGETWQLASCIYCTCRVGHVLCRAVECPAIACKDPMLYPEDQCCPKCPSATNTSSSIGSSAVVCTDHAGVARVSGSSWKTDDCTSCTCNLDAQVLCYQETCPDISNCKGSPLVIKGRCCPVCSDILSNADVCSYKSSIYSVHEEWKDGECSKCSCIAGGQTVCRETVCPHCSDPVPIEGQCCPLCKDVGYAQLNEAIHGSAFPPSVAPPSDNTEMPFIGIFLAMLTVAGIFVILFILYKRSRSVQKPVVVKETSCVRLSSSKHIGSTPHLPDADWFDRRRRDSHSDGQSESLLSTVSDTSTSASSSASSGIGPHNDTRPLTGPARGDFFQHV